MDRSITGEKKNVVIEVRDNLNELLNSPAIGERSGQSIEPSIYKIPHFMKEIHPKAFEPQLVSFGPYHFGKQHLLSMELEKLKALHHFKTNYRLDVEFIVMSVSSILADLQGSYDNLENEWKQNPSKFLQVMVMDGCFMLEFFSDCPQSLSNLSGDIKRDMLLLENQLPMLDKLYSIAKENHPQLQVT